MNSRRQFLGFVGSTTSIAISGCSQSEFSRQPGDNAGAGDEAKEFPLPGEPISIVEGELPVLRTATSAETESIGFDSGADEFGTSIEMDGNYVGMEFSPHHTGTGEASGFATGVYQTAWKAPRSGNYRITAKLFRSGDLSYDRPENGDVVASFDMLLQMVQHGIQEVVSRGKLPQLQTSDGVPSKELQEFLIETALTAIIGRAFGLRLIGRLVLKQIIQRAISLGKSESDYDGGVGYEIVNRVHRDPFYTQNFSARFRVPEGTILIFEVAPTVSWSYELRDSAMKPYFDGSCEFEKFVIESLD